MMNVFLFFLKLYLHNVNYFQQQQQKKRAQPYAVSYSNNKGRRNIQTGKIKLTDLVYSFHFMVNI